MTIGAGDALFGGDGTGDDTTAEGGPDGVGPLPGFELPVLKVPAVSAEGVVTGVDALEEDDSAAGPAPAVPPPPVRAVPGARNGSPSSNGAVRPASEGPLEAGPRTDRAEPAARETPPVPSTRPAAVSGTGAHTFPSPRPTAPPPSRHRPPVPPRPDARPRIPDEPGILGLSRVSRSRIGSRLFTWFFVLIFTLIAVQMVVALLTP
jgi:hypothetical protein